MMGATWRAEQVHRPREEEQAEENPKKRQRRGQYGGRTDWGTVDLTEDEKDKNTWLMGEVPGVPVQKSRQSKLSPWSGNKLMAREMVMEVLGAAWESMKATKLEEVIDREQKKETATIARRAEEVEI